MGRMMEDPPGREAREARNGSEAEPAVQLRVAGGAGAPEAPAAADAEVHRPGPGGAVASVRSDLCEARAAVCPHRKLDDNPFGRKAAGIYLYLEPFAIPPVEGPLFQITLDRA